MKSWVVMLISLSVLLFGFVLSIMILTLGIQNDWNITTDQRLSDEDRQTLVLGIGLPRTGTCSISAALNHLGYYSHHFPINLRTHDQRYLQKRNALVDLTILGFRPLELYQRFPHALFIYSKREDNESWLSSMHSLRHLLGKFRYFVGVKDIIKQFDQVFGTTREEMISMKIAYETEIEELKRRAPSQVLITDITGHDVTDKDRWESLCTFLNYKGDIPSRKFFNEKHLSYQIKQLFKTQPRTRKK